MRTFFNIWRFSLFVLSCGIVTLPTKVIGAPIHIPTGEELHEKIKEEERRTNPLRDTGIDAKKTPYTKKEDVRVAEGRAPP